MPKLAIDSVKVGESRRELRNVSQLAESINTIGLLQPITVTSEHVLIAGYHRLQACKSLGWKEIEVNVVNLDTLHAELAEIDENLIRNELNPLERGEQLLRRKQIYLVLYPQTKQGGTPGNQHTGKRQNLPPTKLEDSPKKSTSSIPPPKSFVRDTSTKTGQSERAVRVEIQIAKSIDKSVKEQIRNLPLVENKTELLEIAKQTPETQKRIVDRIASGEVKNVRQAIQYENREKRTEKLVEIAKNNKPLGTDLPQRYSVIYADPPWRYEHAESESRAIENQYPTMDLDDIRKLPVPNVTTPDAILFMWATAPKLEEAISVLNAWEFRYRSQAIWDKQKMGMGYYFRTQHEILIVATKGNPPTPPPSARVRSVVSEPCGEHSAKPDVFYKIIEDMYPSLPKLELFSRSPREGWAAWGNQT